MRHGYKALPGATAMLAAAMAGTLLVAPAFGPSVPRQLAGWAKKKSKRSLWRDRKRDHRRRLNREGFLANLVRKKFLRSPHAKFRRIVNKMTNHERSVWGRNGYPGLRDKDIKALTPFAGAALRRLEAG